MFPISAAGVKTIVATFDQLHQLLAQSLREFQAGSNDLSDPQEQELTQALHRLTGRLKEILATTSDPSLPSEFLTISDPPALLTAPISLTDKPHIHFVTSCEGVVLMANNAVCDVLGIDLADMGKVSVAECIPQEEWRVIRNRLLTCDPLQGPMSWNITLCPSEGPSQKVACVVTPMFDQSRKVTAWHWGMTVETERWCAQPFFQLVQSLEAQLFAGQSMEACLTQICEGLVHTFGFPFVWVATVRKGYGVQLRAHAVTALLDWESHGPLWWSEISRQEGFVRTCEASEISLLSGDDPQSGEVPWFPPVFQLHDTLRVPLACPDGLSGVLVVCSTKAYVFDATVTGWLGALGDQIERLMKRGRQLEQWRIHSAAIGSVTDAVCVTDPHGRLEWVNDAYTALLGLPTQEMVGSPLSSFPHAQLQDISSLHHDSLTKNLCCVKTEVLQTGRNGESLVFEQVVTPLVNEQGQLTHFVVILHDVTARKTQELLMKHQAYHDPLTDLPNRVMFEDRLQQGLAHARRNGTLLALFFLDLDNFKPINDYYGHQIGDRVLRVVAKRLATCVRSTDTVARLCGDEFTVILQGIDRIQDIRQVAQKILECLTPPVRWGGQEILIQISIGIAVYPKDSTTPHQLLEIADHAMYRAKECGGQCWYFATTEWNAG